MNRLLAESVVKTDLLCYIPKDFYYGVDVIRYYQVPVLGLISLRDSSGF